VASIDTVRERLALQRYLDNLEKTDEEPQRTSIDLLCSGAVKLTEALHRA